MKTIHFSDEQLQEILDDQTFQSEPVPPLHLKTCPDCRERYESFRRLYAGLAVDPGFSLPPGFADAVLERIPAPRQVFWRQPAAKIALAAGASALGLAGLFIFVDMRPLAGGWLRIFSALDGSLRTLSEQFRPLFAWLGGNAKLFALGGIGLFGASIVDHLLRRQLMHRGH
jgi:hypothetical protein